MNNVVVIASRLDARRMKNDRETSDDAVFPISVVALSMMDNDVLLLLLLLDVMLPSFCSLLMFSDDALRVIVAIPLL